MKKLVSLIMLGVVFTRLIAVDIEDTKQNKDILFNVEKLKYVGDGKCEIVYSFTLKDDIKNPLYGGLKLYGKLPDGEKYYIVVGSLDMFDITPGNSGGSMTFNQTFNLLNTYHLKQKEEITIKESDVPEKILIQQGFFIKKPFAVQNIKKTVVGYLSVKKDSDGNIATVEFKK